MRSRHHWIAALSLSTVLGLCGCSSAPSPPVAEAPAENKPVKSPSPPPAAATTIAWPAVTSVLEGTDLVKLDAMKLVPFDANTVEGDYRSEQGGSVLTLNVRKRDTALELDRTYQEPGDSKHRKTYSMNSINSEGGASSEGSVFLRMTEVGILMLETKSGVESIPAGYWIHYERQRSR